jgi:acetyl esterase/lipase
MRRLLARLLLLTPLLIGQGAAADEHNLAYGPDPQEQLDICTPTQAMPRAPAVLMIHGGGWRVGSRHGLGGICRMLAQQGIVVFDMDYRLLTAAPATKWPAQVNDVQLAMRWVRAHANTYGIDPAHICAEGDSAGGHLALLLDVLTRIHHGDRAGMLPGISPVADCVVDVSGIADLQSIDTAHPGYANFLIGGDDPERLRQQKIDGSAALQIHAGAGPALLIHGLQDPLVPYTQATEMLAAFARVGTPAWLISHQGGHELNGMSASQAHEIWTVVGDFIKTRRLARAAGEISVDRIMQ